MGAAGGSFAGRLAGRASVATDDAVAPRWKGSAARFAVAVALMRASARRLTHPVQTRVAYCRAQRLDSKYSTLRKGKLQATAVASAT